MKSHGEQVPLPFCIVSTWRILEWCVLSFALGFYETHPLTHALSLGDPRVRRRACGCGVRPRPSRLVILKNLTRLRQRHLRPRSARRPAQDMAERKRSVAERLAQEHDTSCEDYDRSLHPSRSCSRRGKKNLTAEVGLRCTSHELL